MDVRAGDLASTWDRLAADGPDRVAVVRDGGHFTWGQFSERANRLAWHLETEAGVDRGDRVAIALPNSAEYLETFYAALKLGCAPVNVDVRQRPQVIHAILDHSDAKAVVHAPEDTKVVKSAAKRIPKPWRPMLLSMGDEYEQAIAGAPSSTEWQPRGGAPDDVIVLYVDGSAAPPTALVWRSDDLADAVVTDASERDDGGQAIVLHVAPLTHSLALFGACRALVAGDAVALVPVDPFEPRAVWDTVAHGRVTALVLPSDRSTAKLVEVLGAEPQRWDLSRLATVTCRGRLAEGTRTSLARLLPNALIRDLPASTARTANEKLRVIDDVTDRDVEPGSGRVGLLAVGGAIPLGYYKDPEKTSRHFRTIDGARYWLSGEHAMVGAAGEVRSAAPDSEVVVVDGSAVSASAVEFVLRKHRSVAACTVVGIGDSPSHQRLVALVQVVERHHLDEPEMTAWCRSQLTATQTPRHFLFVDSLPRTTADADDRGAARALAAELLERRGD